MKKIKIIVSLFILGVLISGCTMPGSISKEEKNRVMEYASGTLKEPKLSYNIPEYDFEKKDYNNSEYNLPLNKIPENYERDIRGKFDLNLTNNQKEKIFKNGVVIIPGNKERFKNAYTKLNSSKTYTLNGKNKRDENGVPTIITTDSIMHLFHIEFNEMLKNLEINELDPLLNDFLTKALEESENQYKTFENKNLKELIRRNITYLSVAKKLLNPDFNVLNNVKKEVDEEIKRINDHKGFYKNPLFSKDCPNVCENRLYPKNYNNGEGDKCNQAVKGKAFYNGKEWDFQDLYKEVCIKTCYCEDYSQYKPRGHYTSSKDLEEYFKSMMWLGRMTFKAKGENWTKQAILLTDAVKSADAIDLWDRIYNITGFFAGASDDLSFYDYDKAVFNLFNYKFKQNEKLDQQIAEKMQKEIRKMRGPKILGGFEFDLGGTLKDTTQGLRLLGQRYALDSHILSDLIYNNVGVNPKSDYYGKVINCENTYQKLSKPNNFYYSCNNMEEDNIKYWNEVCSKAMEMYQFKACGGLKENELWDVCRFMPTGLDISSVLGSKKSDQILKERGILNFCNYNQQSQKMKNLVDNYSQEKWTKNLYNSWLWMIQPVLEEKTEGYPNWMRSHIWKAKDLITGLSSWAELRHDTILYIKQSYTRATMMKETALPMPPMQSKYYGYVEPNPELFARAKFIVEFLRKGLKENQIITESVDKALEKSSNMMARLKEISEKELQNQGLTEKDYDYIENISSTFDSIIKNLASALVIETEDKPIGSNVQTHKNLAGKDDAFKTSLIADVHTETNTKKALEVGSGKIDWLIVAHKAKDGRIGLAVGPMFSYYEFPWPMKDRLTDKKWRKMFDKNEIPDRPDWIQEVIK